jgi:hypothetical protein
MATTVNPSETTVELSLVERISVIEEQLKDLKRAARQELKARRRRRGVRTANGEKAEKGETPSQLKAWHEEVRKVWDEMRTADVKTPYKRAVAEASARRKGVAAASPAVAVATPAPAAPKVKKATKAAPTEAAAAAAAAATPVAAPAAEAPKVKKAKATKA